ncbi:23S rRNA (pseudouridine(1915)-N(3))-methyltransferase RlmH [Marinilabiliaceae bacterium ANBcel2]|nr:23S rRNA (pseudouridine(1915)-N(3))-methyltransferase RlmH [Marinilabiliaceae bacterium ANBcel2]
MKIYLIMVGKTDAGWIESGIDLFVKRVLHYLPFETIIISDIKRGAKLDEKELKKREGEAILKNISLSDYVVLLDEKGVNYDSVGFSRFIEKKMVGGIKKLIFVVGGAYGFSPPVYNRADAKVSLSRMTFSHQMARLFFVEQLYRALTIIKNEKYHNR